jgi:glyoxylase-like metal-dependent hydrolase (beta-lactamase superfamily II)
MSSPAADFLQALGHGVYAIDTGFHRPRFDAAYLLVDEGRAAFIDTGTRHALPRLLGALSSLGLPLDAVDWVIPTHVHLDHAGGVGPLMQALPQARLLVHPRGARHMIDPSALYQGALAVYGQAEMDRSYGELVGVDADRVQTSTDGMSLALGGRTLQLIDTPGHALHHHCIWDPVSRGWFTGDTFGISYRELDNAAGQPWIFPASTPVQFQPDALRSLGQVQALGSQLLQVLDEVVTLGRALRDDPQRHQALRQGLRALYLRSVRQHGCALADAAIAEVLAVDIELNAQGMAVWLDREKR